MPSHGQIDFREFPLTTEICLSLIQDNPDNFTHERLTKGSQTKSKFESKINSKATKIQNQQPSLDLFILN